MREMQDRVDEFHLAMGQRDPIGAVDLSKEIRWLRASLTAEEAAEQVVALIGAQEAGVMFAEMVELCRKKRGGAPGELDEIIDGAGDGVVINLGTCSSAGVYFLPVFDLIMNANMAKVGGERRLDGKFLKPPGWKAPDVRGELIRQGWKPSKERNGK